MLIFTYGTLMKGYETCPRGEELTARFEFVGHGVAPGVLYDLGPYPGAVPNEHGGMVMGVVYHCSTSALKVLDEYEGVPTLYQRRQVSVQMDNGNIITAWMYYYRPRGQAFPPVIMSGDWRRVVAKRAGRGV